MIRWILAKGFYSIQSYGEGTSSEIPQVWSPTQVFEFRLEWNTDKSIIESYTPFDRLFMLRTKVYGPLDVWVSSAILIGYVEVLLTLIGRGSCLSPLHHVIQIWFVFESNRIDVKVTHSPAPLTWLRGWLDHHAQSARIAASAGDMIILMKLTWGQWWAELSNEALRRMPNAERHPRILSCLQNSNFKFQPQSARTSLFMRRITTMLYSPQKGSSLVSLFEPPIQ